MDNLPENNPYSPPVAHVSDVTNDFAQGEAPFFPVSITKLVIMSLATGGFYEFYWFYKNWKLIKEQENSSIMPVPRAFFGIFFCYSCFKRIRNYGEEKNILPSPAIGFLATGWIVSSFLYNLPGLWSFLSLLTVPCLVAVQSYVNQINQTVAPDHDPNANFTAINWVVIVIVGGLMILGFVATMLGIE